jgi:hypothetical protein
MLFSSVAQANDESCETWEINQGNMRILETQVLPEALPAHQQVPRNHRDPQPDRRAAPSELCRSLFEQQWLQRDQAGRLWRVEQQGQHRHLRRGAAPLT